MSRRKHADHARLRVTSVSCWQSLAAYTITLPAIFRKLPFFFIRGILEHQQMYSGIIMYKPTGKINVPNASTTGKFFFRL